MRIYNIVELLPIHLGIKPLEEIARIVPRLRTSER